MKVAAYFIASVVLLSLSVISFNVLYEENTSSCWNAGCGKFTEFSDAFTPHLVYICTSNCVLRYAEPINLSDTNRTEPRETIPYHYKEHNPLYAILLYLAIIAFIIGTIQLYRKHKRTLVS